MIVTEFYDGQGLGNQLWCYMVTRIIAEKNGYDFGIMSTHKFKGKDFIKLDFGKKVIGGFGPEGGPPNILPDGIKNYYKEKINRHHKSGLDISINDNDLFCVDDNTKIDGNMQSYQYVKNFRNKIFDFIHIDNDKIINDFSDENICIIHIRGGDFKYSSAILDSSYYLNAMRHFIKKNSNIKFYIITDDIFNAEKTLPNVEIIGSAKTNLSDPNKANHHIGGPIWIDYSILNNAKNIIMSASSFGWWPVWTNKNNPNVIAPKYWAAHKENDGYWSCGDSLVDMWNYIDVDGNLFEGKNC
jgi:hypothetical protein